MTEGLEIYGPGAAVRVSYTHPICRILFSTAVHSSSGSAPVPSFDPNHGVCFFEDPSKLYDYDVSYDGTNVNWSIQGGPWGLTTQDNANYVDSHSGTWGYVMVLQFG